MNDSPIHKRLKQSHFESELQQAMLSLLVAADIIKRKQLAVCSSKKLTHSQYNILRILKGCHPEGYCRKDIIERMLEKAPDVTRLIDGLVSEGYAERIPGITDKRMSLTRITEDGIQILNELHVPMQEYSQVMESLFEKKDVAILTELCGRIISHEMNAQEQGVQS